MFWYKFGRVLGMIANVSIYLAIGIDTYLNIINDRSFILDIIAFALFVMYSAVAKGLMEMNIALSFLVSHAYRNEFEAAKQNEKDDLEKLLNDFSTNKWEFD